MEVFTTLDSSSSGTLSYAWEIIGINLDLVGLKQSYPSLT